MKIKRHERNKNGQKKNEFLIKIDVMEIHFIFWRNGLYIYRMYAIYDIKS